jgi:large subunit ribosomal protein L6
MKKDIEKIIEIPEGVEVEVDGNSVKTKGESGEIEREFKIKKIDIEKMDGKIRLSSKSASKKEKKVMNSVAAHIKNMVAGAKDKFEYKLKICASHFPMTVEIKGKEAFVKNFLGEKIPRKVKIPEGVEIQIDKEFITVISPNKELAGQAAANFEKSTNVRLRDRRIFQDGIFITNKAGREI